MIDFGMVTGVVGGAAGALGLAAGGVAYASRWPTSQLFGRTFVDVPEPDAVRHTVALTFDDGPSARNTEALLEVLGAAEVRATFFLIGNHVRRHPELARMVVAGGHAVGNHTAMHPDLARKSAVRVRAEMELCQETIEEVTGVRPELFRPPYGSRRPGVLRVAREMGLTPVLWNVTAQDWKGLGEAAVMGRVEAGLRRNRRRGRTSNVLLHDASHLDGAEPRDRGETVAVVRALVGRADLRFVRVDALMAEAGIGGE